MKDAPFGAILLLLIGIVVLGASLTGSLPRITDFFFGGAKGAASPAAAIAPTSSTSTASGGTGSGNRRAVG